MKSKKIGVFTGCFLVIFILNHLFHWSSRIGGIEHLGFLKQTARDNLPMAIGVYILLTIAGCTVLALPGITFAVLAGLLFGPVLGTVCCSAATSTGAALAFAAGRFFLKDSLRPAAIKNKYLKKWLFESPEENKLLILAVTRLVPVFPYNLQNFAYGITDIKFSTYAIGSLIFMLPGTAMYTVGAAGIADGENRAMYVGTAVFLAVLVLVAGMFLKKRYMGGGTE